MNPFEAARQVSCTDAAGKLGLKVRRSGGRMVTRCLFHPDNTPSLVLYPGTGGFYCFGCHQHGDAVRLYQQALGLDALAAAMRVCRDFHLPCDARARPSPAPRADARKLRRLILDYREQRVKRLVEKRAELESRMAKREDELYHLALPFDEWWDDPAWAQAKEERDRCQEEILRLDAEQLTQLWREWQQEKEENGTHE